MRCKIFVNYRREDSIATAGRLHDRLLKEFGKRNIFMDVDSIPAGVDFVKHLHDHVATCDLLLAIIGPRWLQIRDPDGVSRIAKENDFVAIEIAGALQRDVPVIPILVDGAQIPHSEELPETLKSLPNRNAVEIRNTHFHADASRLIDRIREILPASRRSHGRSVIFAALLGTVMGTAILVYEFGGSDWFESIKFSLPDGFSLSDFRQPTSSRPPTCEVGISAIPEPVPLAYGGRANLALLKQATASASSVISGFSRRHQVNYLNDGWYNNCRSWIPAAMPAWVELDLGAVFGISMIRLGSEHTAYWNDRAPSKMTIQLRVGRETAWSTIYTRDQKEPPITGTTTIRFDEQAAEFVRVNIEATASGDLPRLDELEVYGRYMK